jgi:peptide/nickel transport system ATP-binding protein
MAALLEVRNLKKHYVAREGLLVREHRLVRAVDGVTFSVDEGETLGIVGESGSGKSTLARTILFLEQPTSGQVYFAGVRLTEREVTRLRRRAQMVFQDPYTSLPPRMRVRDIIGDPLLIHRLADRRTLGERVARLLEDVGMKRETADRFPHQFSGGQRQRIGIARALSVEPSLLIADEAVSSLDVSVQAQILNLLKDLQARLGLTYLFVSHDLGVVEYMSHRIAVMYLGEIVEIGASTQVYVEPLHPYTRALLSAVPTLDPNRGERIRLQGEPPDPADPPPGCKFHPRCPIAQSICTTDKPRLTEWIPARWAACHFALAGGDATRDNARLKHEQALHRLGNSHRPRDPNDTPVRGPMPPSLEGSPT